MGRGPAADAGEPGTAPAWWRWTVLAVALIGAAIVAWACLTQWGGIVHGHPAYPALLGLTLLVCGLVVWRCRRPLTRRTGWRWVVGPVLLVAGIGALAVVGWLRPLTAAEPALAAMVSDADVTVAESATRIELSPTGTPAPTAVFFQPGALVDPRAYAAVLRPVAEAGYPVVIAKAPLGVAFLATGAFDDVRSDHPAIQQWVVGGHSLGGVVAALEADDADEDPTAPAVGLFFYASYPAGDISDSLTSAVLSISGSQDGLSTPAKIEASMADLPADAEFAVIEGAVHAFFGDYGEQRGDGTPTISHDQARTQISAATLHFVEELDN